MVLLISSISYAIMPPIQTSDDNAIRKVKPGQEYMIMKDNAISCKKLSQVKSIFNTHTDDDEIVLNTFRAGTDDGTINSLKLGDVVKIVRTENYILGGESVPFYLQVTVNKNKEKVWICAIFIMF